MVKERVIVQLQWGDACLTITQDFVYGWHRFRQKKELTATAVKQSYYSHSLTCRYK